MTSRWPGRKAAQPERLQIGVEFAGRSRGHANPIFFEPGLPSRLPPGSGGVIPSQFGALSQAKARHPYTKRYSRPVAARPTGLAQANASPAQADGPVEFA